MDPYPPASASHALQDAAAVMVCLSVIADGPRISFAAYNEETNTITLEQCCANGYEVQAVVERLLAIVRPTLLLLSRKIMANEALMECLTKPVIDIGNDHDNDDEARMDDDDANHETAARSGQSSIPYQAMKSSVYDVRRCKTLILQRLRVRSVTTRGADYHQQQQHDHRHFPLAGPDRAVPISAYHALASLIDFEEKVEIQAIGSLLSFLSNTIFRLSSDHQGDAADSGPLIVVSDIVRAHSSMYMAVSAETLAALHIFATEHHPLSVAKGTGNSKEGFSLFSLLDRTKSRRGRERLKEWMLKPLTDIPAIIERQDGIELFVRPEFDAPRKLLTSLLGKVAPVDRIILRILKCCAQPQDFISLYKSLETAINIYSILQQEILWKLKQQRALEAAPEPNHSDQAESRGDDQPLDEDLPKEGPLETPEELAETISAYIAAVENLLRDSALDVLREVADRLKAAVDMEASSNWHSALIQSGYDRELDMLKERYQQLPEVLENEGEEHRSLFPHLRDFMDVIFLPQIGFLVRLTDDEAWQAPGDAIPNELEWIFSEKGLSFFKTDRVRFLDESLGDPDCAIKDREALLIGQLEDFIVEYNQDLQSAFNSIADLDCILSLSACALDNNYVRPTVLPATQTCIQIRNGRHPLQEMQMENSFVPNSTFMDSSERLNIITGPNYSGKSCYARQVGTLVYMAQIGSFLPCDEACISIFRQMFARFSTVESCTVPQSSFQLDLSQMGNILRRAGPFTLVLIDEFGKGTSPASGIALLVAALKKLADSRAFTVCTTHFLEIFSMNILREGENGVKANQMAVQIPDKDNQFPFPLFRLEAGVASSSAGLACARLAGLKESILERAAEIVQATRDRRQVRPLTEILRGNLNFSEWRKEAIVCLVNTDWNKATAEDVEGLVSLVEQG